MALNARREAPVEPSRRGPRCTVCIALDALPREDADTLRTWMADPQRTFAWIAEQTNDDPDTPNLGVSALARHTRGQCERHERLR